MVDPTARMGAPPATSLSGLTVDEAQSFHRMFITSFIGFTIIAIVAHWAVWQWRPSIPGVAGYPATTASAPATASSSATIAVAPTP